MKQSYSQPRIQKLPIEEWRRLGTEGTPLPVTIRLDGDSMRPLIRRGKDRVTILPLARELKIGDIVLFRGGADRYVVHRVHKLRSGCVCTLGDNCWNTDGWMPLENVWGLVIRMERNGKAYSLDCRLSRAFGRIWMALHPLRMFYRRCRRLAGRCYRFIFPRK